MATRRAGLGSTTVARLGELIDAADLPGFVAEEADERCGLVACAPSAETASRAHA